MRGLVMPASLPVAYLISAPNATAGGLPDAVHESYEEEAGDEGDAHEEEDATTQLGESGAQAHEGQVEEGGLLSALLPECSNFWVNSLHGQGAKVVSPRLRVEARSPDGLVEAVSVINHPFALGVQWHPEWNSSEYALSRILFEGFITACQHHIAEKQRL